MHYITHFPKNTCWFVQMHEEEIHHSLAATAPNKTVESQESNNLFFIEKLEI